MKTVGTFILMALVVFTGNLNAEECKGKGFGRGMGRMRGNVRSRIRKHIIGALELTEEQKEQAKAIREANEEKIKKYAEALREAHKALREASTADEVDEKAVRALAQNVADAMSEIALIRAEIKKEFKAILTDDQKAKLEEKKAQVKERMENMRKKFEGRRKGFKEGKKE